MNSFQMIIRAFLALLVAAATSCVTVDTRVKDRRPNPIHPYESLEEIEKQIAVGVPKAVLLDEETLEPINQSSKPIQVWPPTPASDPFMAEVLGLKSEVVGVLPPLPLDASTTPETPGLPQDEVLRILEKATADAERVFELSEQVRQLEQAKALAMAEAARAEAARLEAERKLAANPVAAEIETLTAKIRELETANAGLLSGMADQERLHQDMKTLRQQLLGKSDRIAELYTENQKLKQGGAGSNASNSDEQVYGLSFSPTPFPPFDSDRLVGVKIGSFESQSGPLAKLESLGVVSVNGSTGGSLILRDGSTDVAKWNFSGKESVTLRLPELSGAQAGTSSFNLCLTTDDNVVSGLIVKVLLSGVILREGDATVMAASKPYEWAATRSQSSLNQVISPSAIVPNEAHPRNSTEIPFLFLVIAMTVIILLLIFTPILIRIRRRVERIGIKDRTRRGSADPGFQPVGRSHGGIPPSSADPELTSQSGSVIDFEKHRKGRERKSQENEFLQREGEEMERRFGRGPFGGTRSKRSEVLGEPLIGGGKRNRRLSKSEAAERKKRREG